MLGGVDFYNIVHTNLETCLAEPGVTLQGKDMGFKCDTLVERIWNFIEIKTKIDGLFFRAIVIYKTESVLDELVVQKRVSVVNLLRT